MTTIYKMSTHSIGQMPMRTFLEIGQPYVRGRKIKALLSLSFIARERYLDLGLQACKARLSNRQPALSDSKLIELL